MCVHVCVCVCVHVSCPQVSTYAGDNLPCVLIATKDELVMGQALEAAVTAALSDLQLQACVRTSALMGDLNRAFQTLVSDDSGRTHPCIVQ